MRQGMLVSSDRSADLDIDAHQPAMPSGDDGAAPDDMVIPVIREELKVRKRTVETGKGVRVSKTASEREEIVDEPVFREEVSVERVDVNEVITGPTLPTTHYEGQTMIIPILEEVLVVEKRTMLKEELRVTRKRREVRDPQRIVLRTDQVSVEHFNDSVEPSAKAEEQD
jgi:uncharacterized protein (TIGR02271 family)